MICAVAWVLYVVVWGALDFLLVYYELLFGCLCFVCELGYVCFVALHLGSVILLFGGLFCYELLLSGCYAYCLCLWAYYLGFGLLSIIASYYLGLFFVLSCY